MSIYSNNVTIHNLRAITRMTPHMKPATIVTAFAQEGIPVSQKLVEALAEPGALESLGVKPFTYAKVESHLTAQSILRESLAQLAASSLASRQEAFSPGHSSVESNS